MCCLELTVFDGLCVNNIIKLLRVFAVHRKDVLFVPSVKHCFYTHFYLPIVISIVPVWNIDFLSCNTCSVSHYFWRFGLYLSRLLYWSSLRWCYLNCLCCWLDLNKRWDNWKRIRRDLSWLHGHSHHTWSSGDLRRRNWSNCLICSRIIGSLWLLWLYYFVEFRKCVVLRRCLCLSWLHHNISPFQNRCL